MRKEFFLNSTSVSNDNGDAENAERKRESADEPGGGG